eukprot:TRINITY_DN21945_c0_g1_i1.p1 TRINITY_DN21945_c0_g1~~TRINITY_DN21945_c0_g1_i1.p1  ORF type:complete len:278 (+),score=47.87 TRINITY_DN21945_c0_g1_i1:79-834(+)
MDLYAQCGDRVLCVTVSADATVGDLRQAVLQQSGEERVRLSYGGRVLGKDSEELADLGIGAEAKVNFEKDVRTFRFARKLVQPFGQRNTLTTTIGGISGNQLPVDEGQLIAGPHSTSPNDEACDLEPGIEEADLPVHVEFLFPPTDGFSHVVYLRHPQWGNSSISANVRELRALRATVCRRDGQLQLLVAGTEELSCTDYDAAPCIVGIVSNDAPGTSAPGAVPTDGPGGGKLCYIGVYTYASECSVRIVT